jgi:hypothetical protein
MAHIVHTTNRFGSRHLNERQSQTRLQSSWSTKSCRAVIVSCVSCCFRVKHPLTSYLHTHVEHDIKTQVLYMYIFPLCIKTFYFTPPNCFWPMMWHVFIWTNKKTKQTTRRGFCRLWSVWAPVCSSPSEKKGEKWVSIMCVYEGGRIRVVGRRRRRNKKNQELFIRKRGNV